MEESNLLSQLRRDASVLAQEFGLKFDRIVRIQPQDAKIHYAHRQGDVIRIDLFRKSGKLRSYRSILYDTIHELVHEIATNHTPKFYKSEREIRKWARKHLLSLQ